MINFTQQFNVLEVIFATKPPELGLKNTVFFCAMFHKVVLQEDRQRIWDNVNELQEITNITTRSQFYLSMKVKRNPP